MKIALKLTALMAAGLVSVLFAVESRGAEELKFRHIASMYSDSQGLGLKHPQGVACRSNRFLVVADTGNARLLRYAFKDDRTEAAVQVIQLPQLKYPGRVQLNSKNEIFLLDGSQRRIIHISADGKFIGYIDPQKPATASSYAPLGFHIDKDDNIYILDIATEQVIVMGKQGELIKRIRLPEKYGFFTDLTVDARGNVLLIDGVDARLFSSTGHPGTVSALTESMKAYMRFPAGLATDGQGRIYLVDRNGSKIMILARDGTFLGQLSAKGWKEGLLNYPAQMCINDRGDIFVADTNNNRVQIFAEIK